jgi:hypothetical protein
MKKYLLFCFISFFYFHQTILFPKWLINFSFKDSFGIISLTFNLEIGSSKRFSKVCGWMGLKSTFITPKFLEETIVLGISVIRFLEIISHSYF